MMWTQLSAPLALSVGLPGGTAGKRPKEDEAAWIDGLRRGEARSFERLFRAYHPQLCRYAFSYVGNAAVAEELVQDVFLHVWERRHAWDIRGSARTYLYTAVRNAALSRLRHEKVIRRSEPETIALYSDRSAPSADQEVIAAEITGDLTEAIDRLPRRRREIFLLHREEDLTYTQIAARLGISVKTVETQMSRALKALRRHLKHHRS